MFTLFCCCSSCAHARQRSHIRIVCIRSKPKILTRVGKIKIIQNRCSMGYKRAKESMKKISMLVCAILACGCMVFADDYKGKQCWDQNSKGDWYQGTLQVSGAHSDNSSSSTSNSGYDTQKKTTNSNVNVSLNGGFGGSASTEDSRVGSSTSGTTGTSGGYDYKCVPNSVTREAREREEALKGAIIQAAGGR